MSTYYYIHAATMTGYGTTIYVGGCVPSPLLNEDIVRHTAAVRDEDLVTSIVDYGTPVRDRPVRIGLYAGTATVSSVKYAFVLPPSPGYPGSLHVICDDRAFDFFRRCGCGGDVLQKSVKSECMGDLTV